MVFKLDCLEKVLGKAALLISSMCLLTFVYMLFLILFCFFSFSNHVFLNSNNLPWVVAFFVTFVYKVH